MGYTNKIGIVQAVGTTKGGRRGGNRLVERLPGWRRVDVGDGLVKSRAGGFMESVKAWDMAVGVTEGGRRGRVG